MVLVIDDDIGAMFVITLADIVVIVVVIVDVVAVIVVDVHVNAFIVVIVADLHSRRCC